jgi:2-oxoglutarate dehydrogenase E2 component (dihydrolipoamide succinyltransferase)
MPLVDIVMPKLGESIMEATILKWLKQPGDAVAQDETLLEIATDKVDSEVPSTAAGTLVELLFATNDVVPIGSVIARINSTAEVAVSTPVPVQPPAVAPSEIPYQPSATPAPAPVATSAGLPRFYSPLVLKIAQEEGIGLAELEALPGTGADGRVSKKDVLAHVESKRQTGTPLPAIVTAPEIAAHQQPTQTQQPAAPVPATAAQKDAALPTVVAPAAETPAVAPSASSGNVEIVEMDRMRKLIAKHMIDSKRTSAHVTSFTEADVTNLVQWRERVKSEFEKRENDRITFTPLFIEVLVKCLKKHPWLNSSIEGDNLLIKKEYHIGMATALPNGNLIVPVIKNADQLNIVGLSKQVNALANAARFNKLRPDDTVGGTFTLTNVGTFGSLMGTPIINQPQVAILAVGAIKKRPVVIETAQGDSIAIRHMMYLSLSYDHRIIDGALGSTFLNSVAKELEAWDIKRGI